MTYKVSWNISGYGANSEDSFRVMSAAEIIQLARNLKTDSDVIYTYHQKYMSLGARIALWGSVTGKIHVDVQFSSYANVGEIDHGDLPGFFEQYVEYIESPEKYQLRREQ